MRRVGWLRIAGVAAALALSGCAFTSPTALFEASDASYPILDGAHFKWREMPGGEPVDVTFRRSGVGYDVLREGEGFEDVIFIPIATTPEDDYIVQYMVSASGGGFAYAYFWPTTAGYRVYSNPRAFDRSHEAPASGAPFCGDGNYGECVFRSREDAFAYYERVIYPAFVASARSPAGYLELMRPVA